mgnify:CR=1 FL=1
MLLNYTSYQSFGSICTPTDLLKANICCPQQGNFFIVVELIIKKGKGKGRERNGKEGEKKEKGNGKGKEKGRGKAEIAQLDIRCYSYFNGSYFSHV